MNPYLALPSAVALFVALAYALDACLCLGFGKLFRKLGASIRSLPASFTAVATACMFAPLASLYLTSIACGIQSEFLSFLLSWLRIDVRVLTVFLLAPLPPIAALIVFIEVGKRLGILDTAKLRELVGSESLASAKGLRLIGVGYVAGASINALVAIGEEIGWRAYLTPALINYIGLAGAIIAVGIIWGLWHMPIVVALKPLIERELPWATPKLIALNYVASCIALSYPLYLLLATTHSVLPPAAFHGTMNALWRLPQFVIRATESRHRDMARIAIASASSLGSAIAITQAIAVIATHI